MIVQHQHGRGQRAKLVGAPNARNVRLQLAIGQRPHARGELAERRTADAASEHPGNDARACRDAQDPQTEYCWAWHLALEQIGGESDRYTKAELSHPHHNAELGCNRQIVGVHRGVSGKGGAIGEMIRNTL